ncbi:MAG: OmpA family protein [Flavobacteriaceae bacterium]
MTRKTIYFLGILAAIIIGAFFYLNLCSECKVSVVKENVPHEEPATTSQPANPTSYPFSVSDGGYSVEVNESFNFNLSSPSFLMPISEKLKKGITNLEGYLNSNPGKVLNLTGFYTADEENHTAYPNLGLARANSVKNHLTSSGIPSTKINTEGKLVDDMVPRKNVFLGPISFGISKEAENAGEQLKALYEKIKADPLVLYFHTGEAAINLSAEQRQKIADISSYLDKVDGAICHVVGHTDNTGARAINITLGQERADFIKGYLISNGIAKSKIGTSSQGPDTPIASNETAEGRAKNRRTIVTLN